MYVQKFEILVIFLKRCFITHTIRVWPIIYLHLLYFDDECKYTIRGSYGYFGPPKW